MTLLLYGLTQFIASRVGEIARRWSTDVVVGEREAPLAREVERVRPSVVLVELDEAAVEEIAQLRQREALKGIRVIAVQSTAKAELAARARQAGCDEVIAKSSLARRLESLLGDA